MVSSHLTEEHKIRLTDDGQLIPLGEVTKKILGKKTSPSTTWRWIRKESPGGKLEAVCILGKWHTTEAAFRDFLKRRTAAKLSAAQENNTRTASADDAALIAAGLL